MVEQNYNFYMFFKKFNYYKTTFKKNEIRFNLLFLIFSLNTFIPYSLYYWYLNKSIFYNKECLIRNLSLLKYYLNKKNYLYLNSKLISYLYISKIISINYIINFVIL